MIHSLTQQRQTSDFSLASFLPVFQASLTSTLHFRHTSGTKVSLSRVSIDDSIPPSPLRKEFTSEPPIDVPKISACADTSTVSTATLSVSNLPHILEKISDTASSKTMDTDTTSNSKFLSKPGLLCCTSQIFIKTDNAIKLTQILVLCVVPIYKICILFEMLSNRILKIFCYQNLESASNNEIVSH